MQNLLLDGLMSKDVTDILKLLQEHKSDLKKFGIKRIWVFGSYVRGEAKETSNVDILVDLKKVRRHSVITRSSRRNSGKASRN